MYLYYEIDINFKYRIYLLMLFDTLIIFSKIGLIQN